MSVIIITKDRHGTAISWPSTKGNEEDVLLFQHPGVLLI